MTTSRDTETGGRRNKRHVYKFTKMIRMGWRKPRGSLTSGDTLMLRLLRFRRLYDTPVPPTPRTPHRDRLAATLNINYEY